jgi:uncharacterized membrane protein
LLLEAGTGKNMQLFLLHIRVITALKWEHNMSFEVLTPEEIYIAVFWITASEGIC